LTPEEKIKQVFAVTEEDIQRVAKVVFGRNRLSIAVIGPFKDGAQRFIQAINLK
jgi:predicted Zn-dependent peptidase